MTLLPFNDDVITPVARLLCSGGVVILPTDTVYGVACHPAFPQALERIRQMKRRDASKPFQLLAANIDAVWANGAIHLPQADRFITAWPGALTLILPTVDGRTEGYRIPDAPRLCALLNQCGGCLRCTSVNISGEPPAIDASQAARALGASVDLILDGGSAHLGIASTVIRCTDAHTEPNLLRQGAIHFPDLNINA